MALNYSDQYLSILGQSSAVEPTGVRTVQTRNISTRLCTIFETDFFVFALKNYEQTYIRFENWDWSHCFEINFSFNRKVLTRNQEKNLNFPLVLWEHTCFSLDIRFYGIFHKIFALGDWWFFAHLLVFQLIFDDFFFSFAIDFLMIFLLVLVHFCLNAHSFTEMFYSVLLFACLFPLLHYRHIFFSILQFSIFWCSFFLFSLLMQLKVSMKH